MIYNTPTCRQQQSVVQVKQGCPGGRWRVLVSSWPVLERTKLVFSQNFQNCKLPYMEERRSGVHSGMEGVRVADGLLCELENIKDKLLHFDTIGFTGLHPAHGEERTITANQVKPTTTPGSENSTC